MSDTKALEREQFEAWLNKRFPLAHLAANLHMVEEAWQAARESQAKELAEAQARVAVLREALERIAGFTPTSSELHAIANDALTDTADQVREKHVEPTSCGRCYYEETNGLLMEQCPKCKAIDASRAAIGEKK